MNILVTGGAGYIGGTVSRLLLAAGHKVTIYDNLSPQPPGGSRSRCPIHRSRSGRPGQNRTDAP